MSIADLQSLIKGWCPGAVRPMESGDGLVVRLRPAGGIVDLSLAARIAHWSRRWGNGQIDVTSRANLQLRGVLSRHLPDLREALRDSGLLDSSAEGEAVRNIVASPLTGLDPNAVMDVRPVVTRLGQRLATDTMLHDLPGKFGFAIDDGGSLALDGGLSDIRFVARRMVDGSAFDIHLAGAPHDRLGPCRPDELADVAAVLGCVFLRLRTGQEATIRRMRDLAGACGATTIAHEAGLPHTPSPASERPVHPSAFLGVHRLGSAAFAGIGLPFGRIAAQDYTALASAAAAAGARSFRLTPWRAILIPVPSIVDAHTLTAGLSARSFILHPDDPRLRIAACTGAPSCPRATTPVRDDAISLAAAIGGAAGSGILLHLSGCEKGCAHPRPAPVTLLGRNDRYDLVRDGVAAGSPALRNLTLEQAAEQLRHIVADSRRSGAV